MTRGYARAPSDQRAVSRVPRNWGKNHTLIGTLGLRGPMAPLVVEGSVNGAIFEWSVLEVLCPTLQPGQVGVMDNLSSDHRASVRTLVEAQGCEVMFLPLESRLQSDRADVLEAQSPAARPGSAHRGDVTRGAVGRVGRDHSPGSRQQVQTCSSNGVFMKNDLEGWGVVGDKLEGEPLCSAALQVSQLRCQLPQGEPRGAVDRATAQSPCLPLRGGPPQGGEVNGHGLPEARFANGPHLTQTDRATCHVLPPPSLPPQGEGAKSTPRPYGKGGSPSSARKRLCCAVASRTCCSMPCRRAFTPSRSIPSSASAVLM